MLKPRSGKEEKQEKNQEFDIKRHPWAKYAAGSSVTFTMTINAPGHAMTGTHTEKLNEVGQGYLTITTTHAMMGHAEESDQVEDLPTYAGEESLKIDGKEYKCIVWSSKSKRDGVESAKKIWLADSVATPLKFEIREAGEAYALLAVKFGEKVSAGGKDYDCTILTGNLPTERGKAMGNVWMNPEVPGMTVKLELELGGDMKIRKTLELKEFKIAKQGTSNK